MTRRRDTLVPAELLAPTGEPGVRPYRWQRYRPRRGNGPDLSRLLAVRTRPWILCLWEPLTAKIPGPNLVQPHCCYLQTVIFYARPFQQLPPARYLSWYGYHGYHANGNPKLEKLERPVIKRDSVGSFAKYAELEHSLRFDDHIEFDGEHWHIHGGSVRWHKPGWWFQQWARRMPQGAGCRVCEQYEAELASA